MNITYNNKYQNKNAVSLSVKLNNTAKYGRVGCLKRHSDTVNFASKDNFLTVAEKELLIDKFESGMAEIYLKDDINIETVQNLIDDVLSTPLSRVKIPEKIMRTGLFKKNCNGESKETLALLHLDTNSSSETKMWLLLDYTSNSKGKLVSEAVHEFTHGLQMLTEDFYNVTSLKKLLKNPSNLENKVSTIDNLTDMKRFLRTIPDKQEAEYLLKIAKMAANFECEAHATQLNFIKKHIKFSDIGIKYKLILHAGYLQHKNFAKNLEKLSKAITN